MPSKDDEINKFDLFKAYCKPVIFAVWSVKVIKQFDEDISNTLMTMTRLIRTRQGKFRIEDSCTLEDIKNNNFKILGVNDLFDYPVIDIDDSLFKKIDNGVRIENTFNIEDKVMFRYNGEIICIYKSDDDYLKMYKKLRW